MKNMNPLYLIFPVVVIIVGAVSFFGGMKYQQTKRSATFQMAGNGNAAGFMARGEGTGLGGQRGQGGTMQGAQRVMGNQPIMGEIVASDDTSITVKLTDGSTKIVLLSETTTIHKADQASLNDLQVGENVNVIGMTNSDGSVTAQSVQLNPILRMMG